MCDEFRNNIGDFFNLGDYEALLQIGNEVTHILAFPSPKDIMPYSPDDILIREEPPAKIGTVGL